MLKHIILFLISTLVISCQQETPDEIIQIATLKGPSAMGMIKMIDSLSQCKNADINITIYNEPIQVRKLMLNKEVSLAILPTTMGAILYNKGVSYQLAAIPVWGTLYLFGTDTSITQWNDLKGKRIYLMAKGMTPDVLFRHLLIQNGIDPEKDVMLDYSFPTHIDLANAVAAGQAPLGVISEPMVSMVMQKNKTVKSLFDLNSEWDIKHPEIPIAQTALLVNSNFAKENPEKLNAIIKSYRISSDWVNANTEQAAQLIAKYGILPDSLTALLAIPRSNMKLIEGKCIKNQIDNYLKIFYDLNPDIIGGKIPDDNFYLK